MNVLIPLFFFLITIAGVLFMITTKNVVYGAYALALVLIGLAAIYVVLHAELMAIVQLLLYAGGVIILLLFGVMMTNRLKGEKLISESKNTVLSAIVSLTLFLSMIFFFSSLDIKEGEYIPKDQVKSIGVAFLTEHLVAFELIAFILLVALVGAAYLAKMSSNE